MKALDKLCNLLRRATIRYWRVKVFKDFTKWYKSEDTELHKDDLVPVQEAGKRSVEKSTLCFWWEWDRGLMRFLFLINQYDILF